MIPAYDLYKQGTKSVIVKDSQVIQGSRFCNKIAELSWLGQPAGPERNHHHHLMGVQAGVHTLGKNSCQGGATF